LKGFNTKAIHVAFNQKDPYGSLNFPVYDSAAFEFEDSEAIEDVFCGKKAGFTYTRAGNPTVDFFERKLKSVSKAKYAVAFASGMAAISNTVMTICSAGDNIVSSKYLFGHTYSIFTKSFAGFGIEVKTVDFCDLDAVEKLIDKNTRALFFETVTNPQLEVADINALRELADKYGIILIADSTMTPSYLSDGEALGFDIEVVSTTKFFSGGATSVGGAVLDYGVYEWGKNKALKDWAHKFGSGAFFNRLKKEIFRNFGAAMSPHNAYLQSLGLETMALRADKACINALLLAKWLKNNEAVQAVNYPGLEDNKFYKLSTVQFRYPGSVLTFDLGSKKTCYAFMDALKIARRSTNLCDNKTLVIHPHSTIYSEYSDEQKADMKVSEGMLRISVGIEDFEDLADDFAQALGCI
jgi:O-acetylhomoserine (thiol)-lyase